MRFTKLHGLGNDFVLVDRRAEGVPLAPGAAARLCDRHVGIGADGVLSVLSSAAAPLRMHITNPDGSVAEMCGNGLRCVLHWALARGLVPATGGVVETDAGLRGWAPAGAELRVDMGTPALAGPNLPEVATPGGEAVEAGARRGVAVSMGNPHLVLFLRDDEDPLAAAQADGAALEHHPRYPARTNVEFVRPRPSGLDVVVWERGAGLTRACGTGACAAAVAAVTTGRRAAGGETAVRLPGGVLRVEVEPDLRRVWMTGPAVEVFSGEVALFAPGPDGPAR
jgi:diaminopimelate epimerase